MRGLLEKPIYRLFPASFFCIGDVTLSLYAALHRLLGVQYDEHSWDKTRFLLQHYSSKITSFCGRYNSRV